MNSAEDYAKIERLKIVDNGSVCCVISSHWDGQASHPRDFIMPC